MTQDLLETVVTVINRRPHKFFVNVLDLHASSAGLQGRTTKAYHFADTGRSEATSDLTFDLKVTWQLIHSYYPSDERGLHNAAIAFGLESIRKSPEQREFLYTTDEHKRIMKLQRSEGAKLRKEILTFIFRVNELWPLEPVSPIDLQDNMIGSDDSGGQWLNQLFGAGLLDDSPGFKKHCAARGAPNITAYRIAANAWKEIRDEIDPNSELTENKFYKLVDLEIEKEGPFAFVIMPFKEKEFPQAIYEQVIKPAVEENLQCSCVRNDEDLWPGKLDDKFYSHIVKCRFLIAELTTENPNVVYELGIAHARNKEVIMLVDKKHKGGKLSFDYDKFGTIFYSGDDELRKRLEDTVRSLGDKVGLPARVE